MPKQISFGFLTIISSLVSFYFLQKGLLKPVFILPGLIIFPFIWGMSAFLIESSLIIFVTSLLVAMILLFSFGFSLPYLICATLLLFSLLWGFKKAQKEKELRIQISLDEIVPKATNWLFFVLAIVLAIGFYFSPGGQGLKEGIKIPPAVQEKIISIIIPSFNKEITVDEMLNLLMRREKNEPLQAETREKVLKELDLDDLNLKGNEKIGQKPEILDRLIGNKVNQIIKEFAQYIPAIAAIFVFQLIVWLNKILLPVIVFLETIFYLILKIAGFFKVEKIGAEKEVIKL